MNGKLLSIDIETYSSVDLTKCGVYAYVDSPDFTILLLANPYILKEQYPDQGVLLQFL